MHEESKLNRRSFLGAAAAGLGAAAGVNISSQSAKALTSSPSPR